MATKKRSVGVRKKGKASDDGRALSNAFRKAVKRAVTDAFIVRKTIMVERHGWLVMVNKEGKIVKRVKKLVTPSAES